MKKISVFLTIFAAMFIFSTCSEEDFGDKYFDPSKVTSTSVDKLMTGVLERAKSFLTISYFRYMLHDPDVGHICQTWGCSKSGSLYQADLYLESGWDDYIRTVTQFRILEREYNNLPEADQPAMYGYVIAAKAVMYQLMLQNLDEFGKLPYSEVGSIPATGEVVYAHLDDTKELYGLILDDLAKINTELSNVTIPASSDFLNNGDIGLWKKYVNSIRLRAAIRVSTENPGNTMAQKGQEVIKEILGNSANYPIVSDDNDQILIMNRGAGQYWWSTMTGHDNYAQWSSRNTAPKAMVDRLQGDPRLDLIYDKVHGGTNEGKVVGIDLHDTREAIATGISGTQDDGVKQYSFVNERSFKENHNMISYVVTQSEIAFYKAEAIQRGLIGGDAKAEFVRAIKASVKMYAKTNEESDASSSDVMNRSPKVDMSAWNDAAIEAFASKKWDDAPNKLNIIYEQFWLHCSIFNCVESWNVVRRTGVPDLFYPKINDATSCPVVRQRHILPVDEHYRNPNIPDETPSGYTPGAAYWEVLFWAQEIKSDE
jgi:hypothetical protein